MQRSHAAAAGRFHDLRTEASIAWRYLRSVRDDTLIHQLSRITVGGLALGVAALILALSVLTGFQRHLLGDVLERSPDLQVEFQSADLDSPAVAELSSALAEVPGVASVQTVLTGQGWIRVRGEPRPIELIAYERTLPEWLLEDPERTSAVEVAAGPLGGVHLPSRLARRWNLGAGDPVEVITPRRTSTPFGRSIPSRRKLRVTGFLSSSRVEEVIRDRVAITLAAGRGLLGSTRPILDLELVPGTDERSVQRAVDGLLHERGLTASGEGELPGASMLTWRDRHASLLFVLKLEKLAVFLSVTLIVLVASFALVSALALILSTKRHELGLLSAVGMSRRRLRRLFLILGAMLAATGAAAGGVLGAVLAWSLDRWRLIPLPNEIYVVNHVPFALQAREIGAVLIATLLVTLVAAAFGARGAASWSPIEALRR